MTTKKDETKVEPTFRAEKAPDVVLDATPKEEKEVDPTLCACEGVQRRWDGDGIVSREGGITFYQCAACGKKYSA